MQEVQQRPRQKPSEEAYELLLQLCLFPEPAGAGRWWKSDLLLEPCPRTAAGRAEDVPSKSATGTT